MPGRIFAELRELWLARRGADEYFGTLVNAYLAQGGKATGVKAGEAYVDVGTLNGYRAAMALLADMKGAGPPLARPAIAWPAGRHRLINLVGRG
jgi:hypothetical protein